MKMKDLKSQLQELKNKLATMEPNTLGYVLLELEIAEKENFFESFSKIF